MCHANNQLCLSCCHFLWIHKTTVGNTCVYYSVHPVFGKNKNWKTLQCISMTVTTCVSLNAKKLMSQLFLSYKCSSIIIFAWVILKSLTECDLVLRGPERWTNVITLVSKTQNDEKESSMQLKTEQSKACECIYV